MSNPHEDRERIDNATRADLFHQAADALDASSMNASAAGWMAVRELDRRLDLNLDTSILRDNNPEAVMDAIEREVYVARVFVTLQRLADTHGFDVDYGLSGQERETVEIDQRALRHLVKGARERSAQLDESNDVRMAYPAELGAAVKNAEAKLEDN